MERVTHHQHFGRLNGKPIAERGNHPRAGLNADDLEKSQACREEAEKCADFDDGAEVAFGGMTDPFSRHRTKIALAMDSVSADDLEGARATLMAVNDEALTSPDLAAIGEGWARIGERNQAEKLLARAEACAAAIDDYIYIAQERADLGDLEGALRCLEKGQDLIASHLDAKKLCIGWRKIGGCEARARACLSGYEEMIYFEPHFDSLAAGRQGFPVFVYDSRYSCGTHGKPA